MSRRRTNAAGTAAAAAAKKYRRIRRGQRKTKKLYIVRKLPRKNCYRVLNRKSKRIFSKCTTRKNALRQQWLLMKKYYSHSSRKR